MNQSLSPKQTIRLEGFNNLTKTLSFNIYDISYANSQDSQASYIRYVDEMFNAERLTGILQEVADIIGARVLNIARQDYEPQGASVTMLIAEGMQNETDNREVPGPLPDAVVGHLDKSHITVHTYPERHPDNGISTFRVDIDVSTCGEISPLRALNFLIHSFDSDIVVIDYRVRGFTRDITGEKHFIDHEIRSIQNFIAPKTLDLYDAVDFNAEFENIFHTKLRVTDLRLEQYLYGIRVEDLSEDDEEEIRSRLETEIGEIFFAARLGTRV